MLGTADGATHPRIRPSMDYVEGCQLLRQDAAEMGPLRCGEGAKERPQAGAHDARQFVACTRTYIQRTPWRPRELGGQEPGERIAGVAFSLVTFSWRSKRK
jgi:hypothetical protein